MRKLQTNPNRHKSNFIVHFGTSQTSLESAASYGVLAHNASGAAVARRLQALGAKVQSRVFGRGGDTSAQGIGGAFELTKYGAPAIAVIEILVNDVSSSITGTASAGSSNTITLAGTASGIINSYVGNVITITSGTGSGQSRTISAYSSDRIATVSAPWTTNPDATSVYSIANPTTAQSQANVQALVKILKYNVKCLGVDANGAPLLLTVWSQTSLPKNGAIGQRLVVMQDTSATGGVKEQDTSMHATIAGNYSASPKQSVWEYRNPMAGEAGWGRVAINSTPAFDDGCSKIILIGSNYLNFTTGGDSYNVTTGTGTQYTPYISVRQAARDAAAAESVVVNELYDFESILINGGAFLGKTYAPETAQGSADFHYGNNNNQHYSTYGHDVRARSVVEQILHEGWLPSIS